MSDHNILSRHIKPAARILGLPWVNWQVLRRSYGTWMVESGADPKAVQAQMRHSRISTTMDIYAQFVPEAQKRAVAKMSEMVDSRRPGRRNEGDVMRSVQSIVTFCDVTGISDPDAVLILKGLLVELVGIEPTTSSLRTMRSPS